MHKVKPEEVPILHDDGVIVIIDKPAGLLTHPTPKDRANADVVTLLGSRMGKLHPVHRLDRMTTGLLVLARDPVSADALASQFRKRDVRKRYLALVRGHTPASGTIDQPMRTGRAFTDRQAGPELPARTDYLTVHHATVDQPLGRYAEAWFSLVELTLHTGRTHQARRHLSRINHPVVGDKHHGDYAYNRFMEQVVGERYLYLRAHQIGFRHPDGRTMVVTAGLPTQWVQALDAIGITPPPLSDQVTEEDAG